MTGQLSTKVHLRVRDLVRASITLLVAVVFVVTLGATTAAPISAASRGSCKVTNTDTGRTYTRLKRAVRKAAPGAHLVVRSRCRGGTFMDKDLVIVGKRSRRGKPILDGDARSRVLTVKPGVKVRMRDLTIQDGRANKGFGGAIVNRGKLALRDVVVRGSFAADRGGGVYNVGNLQLIGKSRIRDNTATKGGGIYNDGVVRLSGSSRIRNNIAGLGGGVYNVGVLRLRGLGRISRNRTTVNGAGGGVYNLSTTTLKGTSNVRANVATTAGGIANVGASLTLSDSSAVNGNQAQTVGGVANDAGSTLTMSSVSTIRNNEAQTVGGLDNAGTIIAVSCAPQTAANVYANVPDDCKLS